MLKAPFPYFGGKSRIASAVWRRFGDAPNYVEPFAGSLAVLLARPGPSNGAIETVNDADGLLCNFWRSVQADPEAVAIWADWPVNECDLAARHLWLVGQRECITGRLMADPDYYDSKAAGWWVWGISMWIGGGWCSGDGPWTASKFLAESTGPSGDQYGDRSKALGVKRTRPSLGGGGVALGMGVHSKTLGVGRRRPRCSGAGGVHRKSGRASDRSEWLCELMAGLQTRLREVRVCCGDWSRIVTPAATVLHGLTAVFLDPPYAHAERDDALYSVDQNDLSAAVGEWALEHGDDPLFRIALCGYEGEHEMPDTWEAMPWTAHGGYAWLGEGRGRANREREVVWFSPHCEKVAQYRLPGLEDAK